MMGERRLIQEELFYGFSLKRHVPADHLLRAVDRFIDLSGIRQHLAPVYSPIGRPSRFGKSRDVSVFRPTALVLSSVGQCAA